MFNDFLNYLCVVFVGLRLLQDLSASVRTALVIGFVLALSFDSLVVGHGLRRIFLNVLGTSSTGAEMCISACWVSELLLLWVAAAAAYLGYEAYLSGALSKYFVRVTSRGRHLYGALPSTDQMSKEPAAEVSAHRQRTFNYNDALVFNFFDPDNIPEPLLPYAETIFTVAQALAQQSGFQVDNARNQAEHLLMILYNETQATDDMVSRPAQRLHQDMFANYRKWCRRMGEPSALLKDVSAVKSFEFLLEDILSFLLIWGEAANLKHMPECLCFLLHRCLQENIEYKRHHGWNSQSTAEQQQGQMQGGGGAAAHPSATAGTTRYPGFYLDYVVTPVYEVVAKALTKAGDHRERKTYDDFNEFFWSPSCLQCDLHHIDIHNTMASPAPTSSSARTQTASAASAAADAKAPLLADALARSSKTYVEKRSWLHPLLTLNRVFEWHVITFTLLAAWAFSSLLQWTYAYTLQTGSFVFWEITFLGLVWTALEVWTLFPSVNISDPSICGYLLRLLAGLLILSYQSIYYHWSFVGSEDTSLDHISFFHDVRLAHGANNEYQTFWWWQYVWLSLLSCSLYLLQSVLCWFPSVADALMNWNSDIVQAFLSVCYPLSQLYVGKSSAVKQHEVFGYIFFWLTLLAFKLWFGYRYVVSPVSVPSLQLYDDYMNYFDGPDALSFVKTALIMFFWWFPHFLVYLIDLSIWYSVWASVVGGFIAITGRQGAVRESPSFRSHFMRAHVAFCQKLMPDDCSLRDENLARNISTASLTGIDRSGKVATAISEKGGRNLTNAASSKLNTGSRAMSTADIANITKFSFANPSTPAPTPSAQSYLNQQSQSARDLHMLDALDVRSQRWVVFGRVWNEIIAKMRAGDHISNAERDLFLFTHFDWLTKPVYLPLFQTAGCVGLAVVALRESTEEFAREVDVKQKMLIVEKFSADMGVAAKEAVSEAWELTCWVLQRLLGNTHLKDIERLVLVLSNWAENNELFYRFSSDSLEKMVNHVTNIVSTLKGALAKRKSSPVVTTEYLLQRNEHQKTPIQKSEYTSNLGGGRVKKSVSTGFLSALNDATYAQAIEETSKPANLHIDAISASSGSTGAGKKKKHSFKKLEPFRDTLELMDSVRDKVRDEVRNLLSLLRGAIQKGKQANNAETQDLLDRLTFTLALESGFIWNDVYASTQIDDLALDSRVPRVLGKLQGLLKLRVTQVELKSHEARRRLNFFMNSLFMEMPHAPAMRFAKEYTCITPYYSEDILISKETLQERNSDGVSTLLYLQTLYKDDWVNFIERRGIKDEQQVWKGAHLQELRMWAASRAQTLFRTVEGMMQSEAAIRLLAELEECDHTDVELLCKMKFNYVVACQIYGPMKKGVDPKAEDIEFLLARYPNLRVAYVDSVRPPKGGEITYYSVLIKHDPAGTKNRPVSEVYRLKLPGNPILGEGKPENQNHALVFTRGRYLQAIDMNQDGYFEEALKMRNLLEEFDSGCVILGFREHIFTGSVSSVANYMAMQELSFVTLGQRVLNQPLCIRQHYGHPDVFKKLFVMTEGGMSKASRGINLSEDVFAGFNATIRGHTVGFKEYVQVGKGRDVGLQQTYKFEAKLSQGNAEQSLSRDLSRICGRLDFFRLFSFYYGGIGHYMANTMVMFTLVVVVYTMLTFAVFGEEGVNGRPLHPEGVLQLLLSGMGLLQTMPLLVTLTVEKGVWSALSEIGFMILSGGPLYFIFHIETKSYYFSQTLMSGGAMYRPTGRGFVTRHSPFDENYRFFAASHIYLGFELFVALILFGLYTTSNQYGGLTWALWLTVASFLLGPFWFNPLSFEWNRIKDDYLEWTRWMAERGGTSEQSWEAWWREEVRYVDHLSLSWKVFLALQRATPWVLIAVGVAGSKFLRSWEEQEMVLYLLAVFAVFLLGNWIIHKLERSWPYAVRRFATLFLWSAAAATLVSLFIAHGQYVKYTVALYYVAAAIAFLLLLSGVRSQVELVFKMHDYVVGHCIFCLLGILAILQVFRQLFSICLIYFPRLMLCCSWLCSTAWLFPDVASLPQCSLCWSRDRGHPQIRPQVQGAPRRRARSGAGTPLPDSRAAAPHPTHPAAGQRRRAQHIHWRLQQRLCWRWRR